MATAVATFFTMTILLQWIIVSIISIQGGEYNQILF